MYGSIVTKTKLPQSTTVWAEDIGGIIYYIDDRNNVYNTEEIISNTPSPNIIAKYNVYFDETLNKNIYSIPDFDI